MKETETPDETYEICLSIIAKQEYGVKEHENLFDDERASIAQKVAMLYHSERLKSSLPSEQEIEEKAKSYDKEYGGAYSVGMKDAYESGFKDALTLLTKG